LTKLEKLRVNWIELAVDWDDLDIRPSMFPEVSLPSIKEFSITSDLWIDADPPVMDECFAWAAMHLPSLRDYDISVQTTDAVHSLLRVAAAIPHAAYQDTLEDLSIGGWREKNQEVFDAIFINFLPSFPNLKYVSISSIDGSLKNIAAVLKQRAQEEAGLFSNVRQICFGKAIIERICECDGVNAEADALVDLLTICKRLSYLVASHERKRIIWPRKIQYLLRINKGGRILVDHHPNTQARPLPLSLWPLALEKADRASQMDDVERLQYDPTAVFNFVRHHLPLHLFDSSKDFLYGVD
jgi:hypothetical protein